MNIKEFLDQHGIQWTPLHVVNKRPFWVTDNDRPFGQSMFQKMLDSGEDGAQRLRSLKQLSNWDSIAMDTRMVAMIDVDSTESDMTFLTDHYPWHPSYTRKLPKIFVKLDQAPSKARMQTKWPGVELLCTQWSYAWKTDDVHNPDSQILEMSLNDILGASSSGSQQENPPLTQQPMCLPPAEPPADHDARLYGDIRIPEMVPTKYWDDYNTWMQLIGIMQKTGYTLEDAHQMSKRSSKYDHKAVNEKWASFSTTPLHSKGFGSMMRWAKEGAPKAYAELFKTS